MCMAQFCLIMVLINLLKPAGERAREVFKDF